MKPDRTYVTTMGEYPGGNDKLKILALMNSGAIPVTAGSVKHYSVMHDSWCAKLKGTGACNCDPDVTPTWPMYDG